MCPQEKITFSEKTRSFASSQSFRDPSAWTQDGTKADSHSSEGDLFNPQADSHSLEGDLFNPHQHFISIFGTRNVTRNLPLKQFILSDWEWGFRQLSLSLKPSVKTEGTEVECWKNSNYTNEWNQIPKLTKQQQHTHKYLSSSMAMYLGKNQMI